MDGLQWKTLLKWMIWGYPHFWKHSCVFAWVTWSTFVGTNYQITGWRFESRSMDKIIRTYEQLVTQWVLTFLEFVGWAAICWHRNFTITILRNIEKFPWRQKVWSYCKDQHFDMAVSKKLVYADMDGFSFEFQWHISFGLPEALSQRAMAAMRVVGNYCTW